MTGEQLFLLLLRSVFRNVPFSHSPTFEEFKEACRLAKRHDLAHLTYYALEKQDLLPIPQTEEERRFLDHMARRVLTAQFRYAKTEAEIAHLGRVLGDARIAYMPLKGAVLRALYPEPWMRTSCDIDILVPSKEFDRAVDLVVKAGYTVERDRNYHDISLQCDRVHLELHHNIMERHVQMDALLSRVWEFTRAEGYHHYQTPEFFRFHHIAHMAHHFLSGGCGARTVLDLWLLRCTPDHNEEAVRALCEQAQLLTFYENVCKLTEIWFGEAEHDDTTLSLERFILRGGSYGTPTQRNAAIGTKYGKWGEACRMVFMPYRDLKNLYPSLEGKRVLTPCYQAYHLVKRIAQGKARGGIAHIKQVGDKHAPEVRETQDMFRTLGLEDQ